MRWSTRVGAISGIGFYIHWTFWLVIVWLVSAHWLQGSTLAETLYGIGLVLAVFACVLLHELGHALAAKRFGVRTLDITLLPIGGVARLERIPEKPVQELTIALAGPAVNLFIAGLLFAGIALTQGVTALSSWESIGGSLFGNLMFINLLLVAFNLLPAFPMDGGRVLRAVLAARMRYSKATQIAAGVGQVMGILFIFIGFLANWFLIFIGLFVFLGAQQEARFAQLRSILQGIPVRDVMMTRFRSLDADETVASAVHELLAGDQQHFPVVANGHLVGVVSSGDILAALSDGASRGRVGDLRLNPGVAVCERDMLESAVEELQSTECLAIPVVRDGRLVGLVTMENIEEWLMVRSAIGGGNWPPQVGQGTSAA